MSAILEYVFQRACEPPPCGSALLWGWILAEVCKEGSQIALLHSTAVPARRQRVRNGSAENSVCKDSVHRFGFAASVTTFHQLSVQSGGEALGRKAARGCVSIQECPLGWHGSSWRVKNDLPFRLYRMSLLPPFLCRVGNEKEITILK